MSDKTKQVLTVLFVVFVTLSLVGLLVLPYLGGFSGGIY